MSKPFKSDGKLIGQGLFWAIMILVGHVGLLFVIGLMVLIYEGVVTYAGWLLLGCMAIAATGVYLLIRKTRAAARALQENANSPLFGNRPFEISFLGGVVSLRTGQSSDPPRQLASGPPPSQLAWEEPADDTAKDLATLSDLRRKDLLTQEEFDLAKARILERTS